MIEWKIDLDTAGDKTSAESSSGDGVIEVSPAVKAQNRGDSSDSGTPLIARDLAWGLCRGHVALQDSLI